MSVLESGRLGFWFTGVTLVLLASPWVVVAPDAAFWGSLLAVGVLGSIAATAAIMGSRSRPSLTQLIRGAVAEPVPAIAGLPRAAAAALRARGGRRS